jgi:hypothetical protein
MVSGPPRIHVTHNPMIIIIDRLEPTEDVVEVTYFSSALMLTNSGINCICTLTKGTSKLLLINFELFIILQVILLLLTDLKSVRLNKNVVLRFLKLSISYI